MYKKVIMSGLSVAIIAQPTLTTLAASVETKRMSEAFYDELVVELEQKIEEARQELEVSIEAQEVATENVIVETEEALVVEITPEEKTLASEKATEVIEEKSGSISGLSVAKMREHLNMDADNFLAQVETDRQEIEVKLIEEGFSFEKLEEEVKAAQDGARILKEAANADYGSGWFGDTAAKTAMSAAHAAFNLVTTRWEDYKNTGWMEDYTSKLSTALVEFEVEIDALEEKVAIDYEALKDIVGVESYKAKVDAAISEARQFIINNEGKTGSEAKTALINLNFVGVGAKAKLESAKAEWNGYVEAGGVDESHASLNKALDEFQVIVSEFNEKLESDYDRFKGAIGIDEGYQAAKEIINSAQKFIEDSRDKTGSEAKIALTVALPIQKVAVAGAKEAWNLVINTILSDSLESIVSDLVSWIEENATKVDYVKVIETVLDGLVAGKDAQTIVNEVLSQVSGSVDVAKLTSIAIRAVIWYQYNPEKDELIESIKIQITSSEAYQFYLKLQQAKDQLEQLKDYIESGQLEGELEQFIKDELSKLQTQIDVLVTKLVTEGATAIKQELTKLVQDVENFVNKVLDSEEFAKIQANVEELKALIDLINEINDYINSDQLQQDIEAVKEQINDLLQDIFLKTEEQIRAEIAQIIEKLNACVENIVGQIEEDLTARLEKLQQLVDKAEACLQTESGQELIKTVKLGIADLKLQLETISDLLEAKKYCEAIEAKKAFIEKVQTLVEEVKTLLGDKDFCKPVNPNPDDSNNGGSDNDDSNNGGSDNDDSNNGGSDNDDSNNSGSDNDDSNNGGSDNDDSNNGGSDNDDSNNGGADNDDSNNGGSDNNGSENNESTNSQTVTTPNNQTNSSKNPVTGAERLAYLFTGIGIIAMGGLAWIASESRKLKRNRTN